MLIGDKNYKIGVVLTQWKRPYLYKQLEQLHKQTIQIDYVIVFQNENHIDISDVIKKFKVIHVKSDYNTKYFGRFAYFFTLPVDICIVMDDDIIPGTNCIKNYVEQCVSKNAIIGGNGRFALNNKGRHALGREVGIRNSVKYDFVGHLWCFKKDWLYYMFGTKPYTYDTSEDMHLCYSSKFSGNIDSYIAEHKTIEDCCDITNNRLADDAVASFKTTPRPLRDAVEKYWQDKGLKFL